MGDDMNKTGKQDRDRINTSESHEVQYWTKALGVSEQQLMDAVQKVGPMAADVRAHLGKK